MRAEGSGAKRLFGITRTPRDANRERAKRCEHDGRALVSERTLNPRVRALESPAHGVLNGRISSLVAVAYSPQARSDELCEQLPRAMNDSHVAPGEAAPSESNAPAMYRLVIRAEIIPEEIPTTVEPTADKRALGLLVVAVGVLLILSWFAIEALRPDPPAATVAQEPTAAVESATQPPASIPSGSNAARADPQPAAISTAKTTSAAIPTSSAAADPDAADSKRAAPPETAPPSPVDEVIPAASHGALQTIRGTVRVTVQVTLDKQGAVIGAVSKDPGPSRYFERVSLEAARKWTFSPSSSDAERRMLLRFHFRRDGVTAQATSEH